MVNFVIVSEYSGDPEPGDRIKIGRGPLYALERVQALVADFGHVNLWTRKCRHDVQNLGWDADDVAQILGTLTTRHYIDSEWCDNGKGAWAACDAYTIRRREWVEAARKELNVEYFLKFAIGKTGALVLMVSCHT
ncbi:MAG TPA: hypothetical protein DCY64_09860 [Hydrogenophaga sp.]|uniref:type II toxin-antitoxin system MqsR family toxin n=1 Tax=Hydrogenophaga sp. TaxID=1904254 RepID=UPI0008AD3C68|nr:type II toxin-antitoxin system MqsR family toxin [Hydrogenophaga sp.]OGA77849.1 MAG: hypothetical protein A2X73_21490 [Burkholderiales bacterium GWE1_65_30]OGA94199.1 MAG: hypothetical protein A2X72_02110 [Burkholderiales bacterium GWF1_66_17]HAX20574.1 hypothetical protein [Hydrogenophaga sp.]HBU19219.1 hypothetical protein [Hydrogenophaga sp.]